MAKQKRHTADQASRVSVACGLAVLTLLLYSPTFHYPFIHFDDPQYVSENPHVQAGLTPRSVAWAFTTFDCSNWHPVTWLSLELDAQFYGVRNAGGFHATNALLHSANTVLLFLVFAQMTGMVWRSAIVAALFACHPLHVESVAWVAERKDVLSTFFWLLTMILYASYVKKPGWARYSSVFVAMAVGLMAKPMLVTLPCVLLLLDYWPLGRWLQASQSLGAKNLNECGIAPAPRKLILLEKIPLFILALVSSLVTSLAQADALTTSQDFALQTRFSNALLAYVTYVAKVFWPFRLAAYYPHPGDAISIVQALAAGLALTAITALILWSRRGAPYLAVGWLWYLVTLVPVIGIVQVGTQALADRYTYIPSIGIFLLATWAVSDLFARTHLPRVVPAGLGIGVVALCSVLTWNQESYWKDDISLWGHALDVTQNNALAHVNLASTLAQQNRSKEAIAEYEKALAILPRELKILQDLSTVLYQQGYPVRAMSLLRDAIRIDPNAPWFNYNLGMMLRDQGLTSESLEELRKGTEKEQSRYKSLCALGDSLRELGRLDEAAQPLELAVAEAPYDQDAHIFLAQVQIEQGAYTRARRSIEDLKASLPPGDSQNPAVRQELQRLSQLEAIEHTLSVVSEGNLKTENAARDVELAWLCQQPRHARYLDAARLYTSAFASRPELLLSAKPRWAYRAAIAALQAANATGKDSAALSEQEKARWRDNAYGWLRSDLSVWAKRVASERVGSRYAAVRALRYEKNDLSLAGVREPSPLSKLPEKDRQKWREFWADVDLVLAQALHNDKNSKP